MCGFLAFVQYKQAAERISACRESFERLAHRGNSEKGEWTKDGVSFFHHRLSFRDLADGHQPMHDSQKRATIVFNGELYNFSSLKNRLSQTYAFQTRSDTEVILAAYLELGDRFLHELDGEFSFVIYDHRTKEIIAARDPFGVKPLFWSTEGFLNNEPFRKQSATYSFRLNKNFCFSSEIKGIPFRIKWSQRGLNRSFLSLYEEMGTSFENVFALAPGSLFRAVPNGESWECKIERKIFKNREPQRFESFIDSATELRNLIEKSVQNKLEAEVPLGAYLSGGIDSRIAAHEMGKAGNIIPTFTVGFEGKDYDESKDVREFLKKYPNLKGRLLKTNNEALEYAYPHAIYASELIQPYTNGSAKWWLSRFARRHVRGVLTGDGADELFCGYPSYRYLAWWDFYQRNPSKARASLYEARVVGKKEKFWEKGLSSLPNGVDLLESEKVLGWAHPLYAQIKSVGSHLLGAQFARTIEEEKDSILSYANTRSHSSLHCWQEYFLNTHFPTHVLNWVGDRMEMANTLEGRPIYLTKDILQFYQKTPDGYLVRGLKDKAILRKAYEDLGDFARTPKKQFNAPFLHDGPLGHQYLSKESIQKTGLFDPAIVETMRDKRNKCQDPLEQSFIDIFLQNCLVTQMLDQYLVQGKIPERNLTYEEQFLDQQTVDL